MSLLFAPTIQCDLVIEFSFIIEGIDLLNSPNMFLSDCKDVCLTSVIVTKALSVYHLFITVFPLSAKSMTTSRITRILASDAEAATFHFHPCHTLVVFSSSNYSFSCTLNRIGHRFENFLWDLYFCGAEYFALKITETTAFLSPVVQFFSPKSEQVPERNIHGPYFGRYRPTIWQRYDRGSFTYVGDEKPFSRFDETGSSRTLLPHRSSRRIRRSAMCSLAWRDTGRYNLPSR